MTNEQLIRQYYNGDEAALEKLYHKNIGLIRGIAKETAAEFNCLMTENIKTFLYISVRNACIDLLRRQYTKNVPKHPY